VQLADAILADVAFGTLINHSQLERRASTTRRHTDRRRTRVEGTVVRGATGERFCADQ
jgi:hypothetical protein